MYLHSKSKRILTDPVANFIKQKSVKASQHNSVLSDHKIGNNFSIDLINPMQDIKITYLRDMRHTQTDTMEMTV